MRLKNAVYYEVLAASNPDRNLVTAGHKTELMEENTLELCSLLGTLQGLKEHFRMEWEMA